MCERDDAVHDGRREADDERIARILARRPRGSRGWIGLDGARPETGARRRRLLVLAGVLGVGLVVPVIVERFGVSPVGPIALLLLAVALWVGLRALFDLLTGTKSPRIGLAIHTPTPAPRSADARRVRGRVRVLSGVIAPLGGAEVAAFRIMGQAWGGTVDDSGGGVIEVIPEDGAAPIRIDLCSATISLDASEPEREVAPSEALTRFLEERWLYPTRGPLRISEATLADGDPVELDAVVLASTSPEGYRQTKVAQIAEDRADTGAIVRRPRS